MVRRYGRLDESSIINPSAHLLPHRLKPTSGVLFSTAPPLVLTPRCFILSPPLSLGFFSLYPLPLAFHPGIQRRRAGGPGGGARALPEKEGAARAPALLAGGAHRRLPWIREQEGVATLPRYAHRRRRRGPRRSCVEPRRPT